MKLVILLFIFQIGEKFHNETKLDPLKAIGRKK